MSLESRLASLIAAIGPDVKSLQTQANKAELNTLLPTGVKRCNMPRAFIAQTVSSLVSGRLSLVMCPVKAGETYSGITFFSVGATSGPGNQVFALYRPDLTLIGTTNSDGTTPWPASTRKRLALITPWTCTEDGWVYAGIMVTGTTMPTLAGGNALIHVTNQAPVMHGSSNTVLTTPSSFPATANAPTALSGVPAVMLD